MNSIKRTLQRYLAISLGRGGSGDHPGADCPGGAHRDLSSLYQEAVNLWRGGEAVWYKSPKTGAARMGELVSHPRSAQYDCR